MTSSSHTMGIVGLGTIGSGIALQAVERGLGVVATDLRGIPDELRSAGVRPADDLAALAEQLPTPRVVFLYVPAGGPVDVVIGQLEGLLQPGDTIVDGGNSYWLDSRQRHESLAQQGLRFVDMGTSGGRSGARHGACFMAGCSEETFDDIAPILHTLAVEGGVVHAGPPGAGHFVKLVHNGIEFGMLQAIGEGVTMLERFFEGDPDKVSPVLETWRHGSVIRSWLMDLMADGYAEHRGLADVPGHVEDTGEVNWLLSDALAMEVPIPVIGQSLMELLGSRFQTQTTNRAVAAMRQGFGGHAFGPQDAVARYRRESRVGPLSRPAQWEEGKDGQ